MKITCTGLQLPTLMRQLLLFLISSIGCLSINAQCLLPSGEPDTLFPVTNVFNTFRSPYSGIINDEGAAVYNIKSHKGIYYLFGNFTNISKNQGSALVIDSSTNTVFTPQKWRINGSVKGAIADGSGGFFIYGTFSKIGDSSRKYLAQIDGNGKPTGWNPRADAEVMALNKKGDSLFISGAFSSIFGKPKTFMALYSISGDSLLKTSLPNFQMISINCFLVQNDTLIIGGYSSFGQAIRKYNFKDSVTLPWQLAFPEYGNIRHLRFNQDSSCFLYTSDYNNVYLKGVNTQSGTEKFKINLSVNPGNFPVTDVIGLEITGNKAYVVGRFDRITQTSQFTRKGFFAIDATTGTILPDDLKVDGYPTFIQAKNGRLFISGRFTTINGMNRENFAVVDTSNLQPGNWQLAPSDQLTCLAFSDNKTFIGGYFNGINSVHRNGFAAIDSATNTILPWAPSSAGFVEGKKMLIKGDTLFVLGFTHQKISCYNMMNGNDFIALPRQGKALIDHWPYQ